MTDPDSPVEVPQGELVPDGPPASSQPGHPGTELQDGGLQVQEGPGGGEVEEDGGAEALVQPRLPQLQLPRGTGSAMCACWLMLMLILNPINSRLLNHLM